MVDPYLSLLRYIEEKTGFKCFNYKEKPLKRRLAVRMRALNLKDYAAYQTYIQNTPRELMILLDTIPINLSYFYRNPEVFDYFQKDIIPKIINNQQLRFWSAGCAAGEEVYSIVIALLEALGDAESKFRIKVFGTDVDAQAIAQAQKGLYTDFALAYMPSSLVERYFRKKNGMYEIDLSLRRYVEFLCMDLFQPPPFRAIDVVFCRNVLIYFARDAQKRLLQIIYDTLRPDGYLILGKTEIILGTDGFKIINPRERIYQKIS